MCGIYGIASEIKLDDFQCKQFSQLGIALTHRGPDATIEILHDNFVSGFTRLAIVDLANGMQPFYSENKAVMVTANGEIYNHEELREELKIAGHEFVSNSDIEVIPHLYEIYGDSFVQKLRGMYAIALFDKNSSELKLYVDRLGEKPLYWSSQENGIAYSSELVPLLKSNLAKMTIDVDQVPTYLKYGFTLDPFTIIRDAYRIAGGTYLSYSLIDGSLKQTRYWNPLNDASIIVNPVSRFRSHFQSITETIGQGEVPVALALSGGVDSKIVGQMTAQYIPNLAALTVGYSDKSRHDETASALMNANEIGIKSFNQKISASSAADELANVCALIDEPIADIASINYLFLFQLARGHGIKVVLTGHGGDEIFFGYPWLLKAVKQAKIRSSTLSGKMNVWEYFRVIENPLRGPVLINLKRIYQFIQELLEAFIQIHVDLRDYRRKVVTIDFYRLSPLLRKKSKYVDKLRNSSKYKRNYDRTFLISDSQHKLLHLAQFQIMSDYLRVNGFLQIDKLSMSQSIEVRNPLADYRLAETSLFSDWDPLRTPSKALLRTATANLNDIKIQNNSKRGFSPPTRKWYKEILKRYSEELGSPRVIAIGLVPVSWQRYFLKPFTRLGIKSPIWFELVFLELWIRETESQVGSSFTQ